MATKTGILATINGFLTAIITQAKHRSSMSALVDEVYPVEVLDSHLTETYTTKAGTDITYNITITKSGNIAHIKGEINNTSGVYLSSQSVFTWKENQYKPKSGLGTEILFFAENSTDQIRMSLSSSGLSISGFMNPATFNFDFKTYITQD